jgi:ribulose kinase
LLSQLRADVLGRRVHVCAEPDVSLMGAAMVALIGCGIHATPADAAAAMDQEWTVCDPDPQTASRYDDLFADWRDITSEHAR